MDDETNDLLREIRDIALRNEGRMDKELSTRRFALNFLMTFFAVLLAVILWFVWTFGPILQFQGVNQAPPAANDGH